MIDKQSMMKCVRNQLAIDYNCAPDDFLKDGIVFTKAVKREGRRALPWVSPRRKMLTMGQSVRVSENAAIAICNDFRSRCIL